MAVSLADAAAAAAATSTMVSASAPSVYSVQALSLLAEVSHAWLAVLSVREGVGGLRGRPGRGPHLERAHRVVMGLRDRVSHRRSPQKIAVSFGPVLSGSGVSPGRGVPERREGESRAADLPPALLRLPVLTQPQVTPPPLDAATRRKVGYGGRVPWFSLGSL